jgi:nucleoside-diphosphate-sugar epimerase
MTTVAILGCGYVGIELGARLVDNDYFERVLGVRRSDAGVTAMRDAGIEPIQGDMTNQETLASLRPVDVVVFAASSDGRGASAARGTYMDGQRAVIEQVSGWDDPPDRYIYTSSTGVYGDHDGEWVNEETPLDPRTERQQVLTDAESVALEETQEHGIDGTVARFAGLYGPERFRLDRYLEGPVTEGILNLIHRNDAAGALECLIQANVARDEVVLVVDDEPVSKWDLAEWLATQCDRQPAPIQTIAERLEDESLSAGARQRIRSNKRCDNEKLRSLGYEFEYPTFRDGYRQAIEKMSEP